MRGAAPTIQNSTEQQACQVCSGPAGPGTLSEGTFQCSGCAQDGQEEDQTRKKKKKKATNGPLKKIFPKMKIIVKSTKTISFDESESSGSDVTDDK